MTEAKDLNVFPELVELSALELALLREAQVTDSWHKRNDERARQLDLQHFDVLRRTGVI